MGSESARVLADSISPEGFRLTTFEATLWRPIQAELKTHASIAGNAGSSRAIPFKEQLLNLINDPFTPDAFGTLQPGMKSGPPLTGAKHEEAMRIWLRGRDRGLSTAMELMLGDEIAGTLLGYDPATSFASGQTILDNLDAILKLLPSAKQAKALDLTETTMLIVHKELANRGLEAYMYITNILTGTEFEHFFNLRDHADAQGEFQKVARLMREARDASTPRQLGYGEWHTPLVEDGEFASLEDRIRVSAARLGAVSFNRQNVRSGYDAEITRYEGFRNSRHLSPTEHQGRPFTEDEWAMRNASAEVARAVGRKLGVSELAIEQTARSLQFNGKLRGWHAHRKDIAGEHLFQPAEQLLNAA